MTFIAAVPPRGPSPRRQSYRISCLGAVATVDVPCSLSRTTGTRDMGAPTGISLRCMDRSCIRCPAVDRRFPYEGTQHVPRAMTDSHLTCGTARELQRKPTRIYLTVLASSCHRSCEPSQPHGAPLCPSVAATFLQGPRTTKLPFPKCPTEFQKTSAGRDTSIRSIHVEVGVRWFAEAETIAMSHGSVLDQGAMVLMSSIPGLDR